MYVEIKFLGANKYIFKELLSAKNEIDNLFDCKLEWNKKSFKVGTYMPINEKFTNNNKQIKEIVKALDEYIRNFSRYIN